MAFVDKNHIYRKKNAEIREEAERRKKWSEAHNDRLNFSF